jgi:hypothetical protein
MQIRHRPPPVLRRSAAMFLLPGILLVTAAGCQRGDDEIDEATRLRVIEQGEAVATRLMQTLSERLLAAMSEGGPEHAIAFCAQEAEPLTASVVGDMGAGWDVRRTTLCTRNPANEPDRLEVEALEFFHAAEAAGQDLPQDLVQRTPAGDYRYYRPLLTATLCVQCHGPVEGLDSAVVRVLADRYPDDQATGYEQGDLRGLIRVTVPAAAVR